MKGIGGQIWAIPNRAMNPDKYYLITAGTRSIVSFVSLTNLVFSETRACTACRMLVAQDPIHGHLHGLGAREDAA